MCENTAAVSEERLSITRFWFHRINWFLWFGSHLGDVPPSELNFCFFCLHLSENITLIILIIFILFIIVIVSPKTSHCFTVPVVVVVVGTGGPIQSVF